VSENRVLRRTFGPKREEVVGGWRRLHNEELHKVIKSRRIGWAGNVARMGDENFLLGNLKGRDHAGDVGVHGRITYEWNFGK
jgi:hypothetical protein